MLCLKKRRLSKNLLLFSKSKNFSGRNNSGKVVVRCRGGGFRRQYRILDFRRRLLYHLGIVIDIFKDPNRNSKICLVLYKNCGLFSYMISPSNLKVGDLVVSFISDHLNFSFFNKFETLNFGFDFNGLLKQNIVVKKKALEIYVARFFKFFAKNLIGCSRPLRYINLHVPIFNIESKLGFGGKFVRSAGCFGFIVKKINFDILRKKGFVSSFSGVKLPSGKVVYLSSLNFATYGRVSNSVYRNLKHFKAGEVRWSGFRPKVRGVAMNPVDHPHGGGEGKSSGGRPSVSRWGLLTKGFKTLSKKKRICFKVYSSRFVS